MKLVALAVLAWLAPAPILGWVFAQTAPTADPVSSVLTSLIGSSPVAAVFFWRLWVADKKEDRMWSLIERSAGLSSAVLSEAKDVRQEIKRGRDLSQQQLLAEIARLVKEQRVDEGTSE